MGIWKKIALFPIVYILATNLLHVLYFSGPSCNSKALLYGKTVIVTGANTGIGKATALDMARRGARVILACRSEKRTTPVVKEIIEQTRNPDVVFMQLDLSSFKNVQQFTDTFLKNENRLDILINNAGMISNAMEKPELNEDGIEITLVVNHLGHFLLTRNLLDLLKKSGPGSRVVTVSSMGHDWANPTAFHNLDQLQLDGARDYKTLKRTTIIPSYSDIFFGLSGFMWSPAMIRYCNSKLANILFSSELAKRIKGMGITAYSLHPGAIITEIGVNRLTGIDMLGGNRTAFNEMVAQVPDFIQPISFAFKTLNKGAQTSICCAVDEQFLYQSGLYYSDCVAKDVTRPELSDKFSEKFWEWSEKLVSEAHPMSI